MRLLLIDIDSLRPDHLGCYGYERNTSPAIDAIAARGVRWVNCYASDAPCLPSRSAFFGGRFGITSGIVNHGGRHADPPPEGATRGFRRRSATDSFGESLRRAGWYTASVSSFPHRHSAYQIWDGFSELHDPGGDGYEHANVVFAVAEDWLRRRGRDDRWFLHVNLWDPHTPYDTPGDPSQSFDDSRQATWLSEAEIERQRRSFGPHDAVTPRGVDARTPPASREVTTIASVADAERWLDGYDAGIRYADEHVGKLVDLLGSLGVLDDTAVVVTADHGENQGELGVWGDHQTADHHTCNVPLIIAWPGVTDAHRGAERHALIYHVDAAATLLDLAGAAIPAAWDGRSFAASIASADDDHRDHLVLSQLAWSCQRSVRRGDHLLIRTYDTGLKDLPEILLFDLVADPHETTDLSGDLPELVGDLSGLLDEWTQAHAAASALGRDPLAAVLGEGGPWHTREMLVEMCRVLRATGRGDHATWLETFGGAPRAQAMT